MSSAFCKSIKPANNALSPSLPLPSSSINHVRPPVRSDIRCPMPDAIEYQSILLASSHPALPPPLRPHSKERKEEETWARRPKSKQAKQASKPKKESNPKAEGQGETGPCRRFLQFFIVLLSCLPSIPNCPSVQPHQLTSHSPQPAPPNPTASSACDPSASASASASQPTPPSP